MIAKAPSKTSLLVLALTAALSACGGGGGSDPVATPAAPAPAPTGTTTTATAPSGQTLTATTGTSSGTASNTEPTINVGAPAAPIVPAANVVVTSVPASTYATTSQAAGFFSSVQDWRSQMRFEEEGRFGVGLLTQRSALDTLAASLVTSQPNLVSSDPALRAAAAAAAAAQMASAGYPIGYAVGSVSTNTIGIATGQFCSKAIFSSLPGVEIGASGMRFSGISIPETPGANCVMLAGLETAGSWQLPPTGSSSVYPFPAKQLTLPRYYGDWASLGFTSQPGHSVYVSLASVDALPVAVPGAGSGAPIATSAITINEFTLRLKSTNAPVAARIFTRAGVVAGAGVTLTSTTQLQFPTSIVMVPEAPLGAEAVYTASFRATVNGRNVQRTWDFTTSN